MKIVFFGTPPISAHILEYLIQQGQQVVAVVTRPDRPKGRSQKMQPSAVKALCQEKYPALPLFQPEKASSDSFADQLRFYEPDVFVVVAYGEIIKQNLLDIPSLMPINIHASLLPKYRGAAPMQRALMDGVEETGVTIMEMVLKMDAGPMLEVAKVPVDEEMNLEQLEGALCNVSGPALLKALSKLENGTLEREFQNETDATFAPKISLDDRIIDWSNSCDRIHNQVRGLSPFPGAFCMVEVNGEKKRLGIKKTKKRPDMMGAPGEMLSYCKDEWVVACGKGALSLVEIQMEGKKLLPIQTFFQGVQVAPEIVD